MTLQIKFLKGFGKDTEKKSHTCKEGGTHLRISFLHLLMNFEKPENQNFEKMKINLLEISSFYTCVPKIMIICSVPEIWHVTHVTVIFHIGLFSALLSP